MISENVHTSRLPRARRPSLILLRWMLTCPCGGNKVRCTSQASLNKSSTSSFHQGNRRLHPQLMDCLNKRLLILSFRPPIRFWSWLVHILLISIHTRTTSDNSARVMDSRDGCLHSSEFCLLLLMYLLA